MAQIVTVSTFHVGIKLYEARIEGGLYVAQGSTEREAQDAVLAKIPAKLLQGVHIERVPAERF